MYRILVTQNIDLYKDSLHEMKTRFELKAETSTLPKCYSPV